jgi:GNAT superfamily N-acetyltransferase
MSGPGAVPGRTDVVPGAVTIRRATAEDAEACGRICYDAFASINARHGFPCDFPSPEMPIAVLSDRFSHPRIYCVVAERDGRILGSNCLDERSVIAGVGPITVDPKAQDQGVGRKLMDIAIARAGDRGFWGIRLLQAAFHSRSLSLYSKLGFVTREPLSVMQGPPLEAPTPGYSVRPAQDSDLDVCNKLCYSVHGHDRSFELQDAIQGGSAVVAENEGRITAYATALAFFGHAVGEGNHDLMALIAAAPKFDGPGILVPTRNAALFRWCLDSGLKVVEPMTLMTIGFYNEPAGAYLPSILF